MNFHHSWLNITNCLDPEVTQKIYISEVKADGMVNIKLAHELGWFPRRIFGRLETRVTHVYLNNDRDSMSWTHVKVQRRWNYKTVGKQTRNKVLLLKTWSTYDINCQNHALCRNYNIQIYRKNRNVVLFSKTAYLLRESNLLPNLKITLLKQNIIE